MAHRNRNGGSPSVGQVAHLSQDYSDSEDDAGQIIGAITGRAYYNEVYIGDLIVGEGFRGCSIGSELDKAEEVFLLQKHSSWRLRKGVGKDGNDEEQKGNHRIRSFLP